mmetsp:Transcript_7126/g.13483  ORF Transcript_7126/g.13483 Transcript_7126/m.13483 type:complete len:252 (-) Transcript_7126:65-820(-)
MKVAPTTSYRAALDLQPTTAANVMRCKRLEMLVTAEVSFAAVVAVQRMGTHTALKTIWMVVFVVDGNAAGGYRFATLGTYWEKQSRVVFFAVHVFVFEKDVLLTGQWEFAVVALDAVRVVVLIEYSDVIAVSRLPAYLTVNQVKLVMRLAVRIPVSFIIHLIQPCVTRGATKMCWVVVVPKCFKRFSHDHFFARHTGFAELFLVVCFAIELLLVVMKLVKEQRLLACEAIEVCLVKRVVPNFKKFRSSNRL